MVQFIGRGKNASVPPSVLAVVLEGELLRKTSFGDTHLRVEHDTVAVHSRTSMIAAISPTDEPGVLRVKAGTRDEGFYRALRDAVHETGVQVELT